MEISTIITLVVLAFLLIYLITLYNGLVDLKHSVFKHLANIDVLLKQRHDELPKLVDTCKRYMKHEQETLEKIVQARSRVANAQAKGNIDELGAAETSLRAGLGQLFALAENYPELKADSSFAHLQQRITGLENAIADRREVYNTAVKNNNVRIEQFPDVVVARMFNFGPFTLLEFRQEELTDVNVGSLFNS